MGCLHWSRLMKPAGVREDSMIIRYLLLVAAAALTLGGPAHAVEINVLSTNALKTVLEELGPKFEESSGQKLTITWGTTAQLKTQIEGGAAFDAAVVTDAVADDLIKQGKLATRTALSDPILPDHSVESDAASPSSTILSLMSALGQQRTFRDVRVVSALPPKADIHCGNRNVCFGPEADIRLQGLGRSRSL
jgi:Bacterial extracellular solute-binding protein